MKPKTEVEILQELVSEADTNYIRFLNAALAHDRDEAWQQANAWKFTHEWLRKKLLNKGKV